MYFTPSVKTYAWSGAGPALLHTPAFGWPAAGQIQVSPVGTTIAGVRLTTLGHAPPGSDFQNVDGGPHQTLAPAACGDCYIAGEQERAIARRAHGQLAYGHVGGRAQGGVSRAQRAGTDRYDAGARRNVFHPVGEDIRLIGRRARFT